MTTVSRAVGPAAVEWREDDPLRWTMSETIGEGTRAERKAYSFDLTPLMKGHSVDLLLALKEALIDIRLRVRLVTIESQAFRIKAVLRACQDQFDRISKERASAAPVFDQIDSDLLIGLWAVQDSIPSCYLTTFRNFCIKHRHNSTLIQPGLHASDFPAGKQSEDPDELGPVAQLRRSVVSSALSRAALAQILNVTEAAYEDGKLTLGVFAFSRLLLSRAARPESFRVLRLKDLRIDVIDGVTTYFLSITIPKARTWDRPVATVRLHPDVGRILDRQRAAVVKRLGSLIEVKNGALSDGDLASSPYTIGDLPLFPADGGSIRGTFHGIKDQLGMVSKAQQIWRYYMVPLRRLTGAKINHVAMRHTIGTQMAIAGCSASTIAAVLLHATHRAASVYVDLIFSGAIDELSDSLEPAFLEHFPVIKEFASIKDQIEPARRVLSPSADRTRHETTGECGRREICRYAPLACYECHRFRPCYDADHAINLERVNEEINTARSGGLPRQVDLKRYMHIANRIRVVINICDAKRQAVLSARALPESIHEPDS